MDKVYENQTVIWCKKVECYCTLFWLLGQLTRTLVKETHGQKRGTFFESGRLILRDLVEDSAMWCVLCHYLQFHYYESILKKSTALVHLSAAINYAQSLGLHRNFVNEQFSKLTAEYEYRRKLFRSLYISDRISSVFIGRPLIINDYDWDDPARFKNTNASSPTT